ncbi:MAG: ATP-binding cassette domain-containing protein, partial [Nitrososphaerales archaeon]
MNSSAAVLQAPATVSDEEYAIKVVDLKKRYGVGDDAVYALQGLDFHVEKGEFVAIIGPSGCGKT